MALKRVKPKDVRLGMYIERFEGDWLSHPFWRSGFLISKESDLRKLANSDVDTVVIDDSKGLSTPEPTRSSSSKGGWRENVPKGIRSSSNIRSMRVEETVRQCHRAVRQIFAETRMGRSVSPNVAARVTAEIIAALHDNPGVLFRLTRLKATDSYTYMHSVAVSALMVGFSQHLKLDDDTVKLMGLAGLMHDIGKATINPLILTKPAALNEDEIAIIRTHPTTGHGILQRSGFPEIVLDVALHHHEKVDGTGYPNQLGPDISSHARIAAICDVYDAVTSLRPYRQAWTPVEALARMRRWDGHLDATYLGEFARWLNYDEAVII